MARSEILVYIAMMLFLVVNCKIESELKNEYVESNSNEIFQLSVSS